MSSVCTQEIKLRLTGYRSWISISLLVSWSSYVQYDRNVGRTYPNEIQRILYKPGGDVGKFCRRLALDTAAEGKRLATAELGIHPGDKKRTGDLARAFEVKVIPGTNTFRVSNRKKYFDPLEFGVPEPHRITARRVEYLQFRGRNGRYYKVKFVIHPGNRAYRIMFRAADNVFRRQFGYLRRGP